MQDCKFQSIIERVVGDRLAEDQKEFGSKEEHLDDAVLVRAIELARLTYTELYNEVNEYLIYVFNDDTKLRVLLTKSPIATMQQKIDKLDELLELHESEIVLARHNPTSRKFLNSVAVVDALISINSAGNDK